MYIARILYPVRVLGPGNRIGIWFCGCPHACPGCSNPELWEPQERYAVTLDNLMQLIHKICDTYPVDGFTLTGGDPFAQSDALDALLCKLTNINRDILVYTGYTYNVLKERHPHILEKIAVLIDGPYIESQNHGQPMRGSDNQNIMILSPEYQEQYATYLHTVQNEIQNFTTLDGIISVGIHHVGYDAQIDSILKQKGLEDS